MNTYVLVKKQFIVKRAGSNLLTILYYRLELISIYN